MVVEGFPIIGSVSTTINAGVNAFGSDLTFADGPTGVAREIQIQIYSGLSAILSIRRNGIDYPINNNIAIIGSITLTVLVLSTDTINFRTDTVSTPLDIIVSGG